jgi:hypothetical protein
LGWVIWQTIRDGERYGYGPNKNDPMLVKGNTDRDSLVIVRSQKRFADVRTAFDLVILYYDVSRSRLCAW